MSGCGCFFILSLSSCFCSDLAEGMCSLSDYVKFYLFRVFSDKRIVLCLISSCEVHWFESVIVRLRGCHEDIIPYCSHGSHHDSGRPTKKEYEKGKADDAKAAEAKANRDKKLAAVNKVITMLDDLSAQVLAEGETKTEAIKKGTDEQTSLNREKLDELINELTKKVEEAEKAIKKLNGFNCSKPCQTKGFLPCTKNGRQSLR